MRHKLSLFILVLCSLFLTLHAQRNVVWTLEELEEEKNDSKDQNTSSNTVIGPEWGEVDYYSFDTVAHTVQAITRGLWLNQTVVIPRTIRRRGHDYSVTTLERNILPSWGDQYAQYAEIYLPGTILHFEDGVFDGNNHLAAIHVEEDNPNYTTIDGVLYDKKVERLLICPQAKADTLVLPKTVKRIDPKAFRGCHELKYIQVEEGNKVYHSEYGLLLKKNTLIAYPAKREGTTKVIKKSAAKEKKTKKEQSNQNGLSNTTGWNYFDKNFAWDFDYITFYEGLCYIPNSVHSIAPWAVTCDNIHRFEVDKEHKYFSACNGVLYSKNEKTLVLYPGQWQTKHVLIPEGVTTIAPYAFYQNKHIHEVTLPTTLRKIGQEAFYKMPILRNVYSYSLRVPQVAKRAFQTCSSVHGIYMFVPTQVEKYYDLKKWPGVYVYPQLYRCNNPEYPLCYISVPDRMMVLEGTVYDDYLDFYAYADVIEHVQVRTYGVTSSPFSDFPNVKEYEVLGDGGHMGFDIDGVLFYSWSRYYENFSGKQHNWELVAYPAARTGEYVVPDSVERILDHAFSNCHLSTLTIPDSVVYVDQYINEAEVEKYIVTPGNPVYYATDGVLFRYDSLMRAYPRNKKDSCYTVPMGTKLISLAAFMKNKYLQEVHITDSVNTILCDAFYGCSNLKSVYIYAVKPPLIYDIYPVPYERRNVYMFPYDAKIYVPEESIEAYKTDKDWKLYADQFFPMPKKENE